MELKSTDFTGDLKTLGRKALLSTRGYYGQAFLTTISPATDLDIDQNILYGIQLVSSYHNLILPIRLLERDTVHQITGQKDSYYAFLGKICLGILTINIKRYTEKTKEIIYTYKYKTDNATYLQAANRGYTYDSGWTKKQRNRVKVRNSLKGVEKQQ